MSDLQDNAQVEPCDKDPNGEHRWFTWRTLTGPPNEGWEDHGECQSCGKDFWDVVTEIDT